MVDCGLHCSTQFAEFIDTEPGNRTVTELRKLLGNQELLRPECDDAQELWRWFLGGMFQQVWRHGIGKLQLDVFCLIR